uniref:ShKT domain-containing protein n=1 Tax=Ditylenchus dipsaci TaxID=166011 RepID=A0A915EPW3_9BILA
MKCCLLYSSNIFTSIAIIVFIATLHCAVAEQGRPPGDDADNVQKHITSFLNNLQGSTEETSVECEDYSLYCAQFHAMLKYQCQDEYFGQAIQAGCPHTCNQCGGNKGNPLIHSHQESSGSSQMSWSSEEGKSHEAEKIGQETSKSKDHKDPTSLSSTETIIPSSASIDPELEAFDVVDEENPSDINLEDYGGPTRKNEKSKSSQSEAAEKGLQEPAKSLLTKSSGKSSSQDSYSTSEEDKEK